MRDSAEVRAAFTDPEEFWSSPLYRRLSAVVAADPFLISQAADVRAGQGPTFAYFGVVHSLLLGAAQHRLGDYYPSLHGDSARPPDDLAGTALLEFAHEHDVEIRELLRIRLVQTNHVQRATGLRLGLSAIAPHLAGSPAHLLEIGTSAGLVLRQSAYGYHLGGRAFGDLLSPVQLEADWRSPNPVPDLDNVPVLTSITGIDLNPLDPADERDRRWLEALVWPENLEQARLLRDALELAARIPVRVLAGDAIDLCPVWGQDVPAGETRVVFHCATRMHVPPERRGAFDRAIADLGRDGPLYRIAIEGGGITITHPSGDSSTPFDVGGHLSWVRPLLPVR